MNNNIKKVVVYCGSSNKVSDTYKNQAEELGKTLANYDMDLVFGGGNIGLMGIVSKTMREANREVIGVTTKKIQASEVLNPHVTESIIVNTLRERKAKMDELSDAVIALPGGFGTIDEVDEMIALKQLGEHKKPIVLFSVDGFWDDLVKIYEGIIKEKFAKKDHIDLFTVATNIDEVIDAIHTEQKDNSNENWRM